MKFCIYTLGCKVNTYESNVMSDELKKNGYEEVDILDESDICIINTCTVTNTSDHKSLKVIRSAIKNHKDAIIVVVGCYSQIHADTISDIDGVSIILGNIGKSEIVKYIEEYKKTKQKIIKINNIMDTKFENMKLNNFNRTRAFVKIEDGCNNFCTYCIIPYSRGNVRSKNPRDVIEEVKTLIKNGHHEIVLTGIHTGHYGFPNYNFADLLNDLVKIEGLERLRISSIELNEITDEVMDIIKNNKVLVSHMHIPLQSGCDKTLKNMNRKYDIKYFKERINKLRKIRKDISITTDVIVGFPDETEEDFNETLKNIEEINFSKVHVFPYSRRSGTKADEMINQIDDVTKKERVHKLIELSKKLEINYMDKFINKEIEMIPEVYKDGYLVGHSGNYLNIKVKGSEELLHKTILVKITETEYPYSIGVIII